MPQPRTRRKACGLPMPPWYLLIPLAVLVGCLIVKDEVIGWKDNMKDKIDEKRNQRIEKRKVAEKEVLISAYDSGDAL